MHRPPRLFVLLELFVLMAHQALLHALLEPSVQVVQQHLQCVLLDSTALLTHPLRSFAHQGSTAFQIQQFPYLVLPVHFV